MAGSRLCCDPVTPATISQALESRAQRRNSGADWSVADRCVASIPPLLMQEKRRSVFYGSGHPLIDIPHLVTLIKQVTCAPRTCHAHHQLEGINDAL